MGAVTACDGLLDEVNYGSPTTDQMMGNEDNVVRLVGQSYAELKWVHDHWGYFGVSSLTADECLCPTRGADWADGGYWRSLNTHTFDTRGKAFKNIWNTTISGAVLCNKLLQTLYNNEANMDERVFKQYVGELEVLRTYYYYLLFDCFGRIPYSEDYSDEAKPLLEPYETWSRLVNTLEKNAPNMAVVTDANRALNYGRVTQGFAYGLLARMYLNAESFGCTPQNVSLDGITISSATDFYTNAVRCCDMVINSGSYSIESDYFANFKIDNSKSRENIFVIVENGMSKIDEISGPDGNMLNKLRVIFLSLPYKVQDAFGLILDCWNGFCARPSFIDRYNSRDVRGTGDEGKGTACEHQWGWFVGPVYDKSGKVLDCPRSGEPTIIHKEVSSLTNAHPLDGARFYKYEIDKTSTYKYCENDFVLMRYADVLWMKEEAILRGGAGASGWDSDDFKTYRKRTFAYDSDSEAKFNSAYPQALTLNGILDERGREFSWEMVRRRDLIRYGRFGDPSYVEYVTNTAASRNWFPIPAEILEKSVKDENGNDLWTQNEGY